MSRDFALLLEHLRTKTGEVELDVPAPQGNGDAATAARLVRARDVAIRRGDRVACLYKRVDGQRAPGSNGAAHRPDLVTSVTETECSALTTAGAKWIGPAELAPVPRPYIERICVRDFRCIQEVDFPLTPLHALIGPNDSGKSTLLETLRLIAAGGTQGESEITLLSGERGFTRKGPGLFPHMRDVDPRRAASEPALRLPAPALNSLVALVDPVRLLRLDPDGMRQPTNLIAQGSALEYGPRGEGLAAVYDALLSRRLSVFLEISKRFTELFPTARAIQLTNPSQTTKALGVELMDGRSAVCVMTDGNARESSSGTRSRSFRREEHVSELTVTAITSMCLAWCSKPRRMLPTQSRSHATSTATRSERTQWPRRWHGSTRRAGQSR